MSDRRKWFKDYPFFADKLEEDLLRKDTFLSISTKKGNALCDYLGTDGYTYLTLGDGCDFEVVKVEQRLGCLYIERAQMDTCRCEWPCGTCIEFHLNLEMISIWSAECRLDQPDQPEEKEGVWSGTLCIGRWNYDVRDGLICGRECNTNRIPAFADNPVLCFDEDGCLTDVGSGANRVAVNSGC